MNGDEPIRQNRQELIGCWTRFWRRQ